MPRSRPPYSLEYRQQMVDLVRGGRTPESLSREFEPTAQSIWNWVRQAERDTVIVGQGVAFLERSVPMRDGPDRNFPLQNPDPANPVRAPEFRKSIREGLRQSGSSPAPTLI